MITPGEYLRILNEKMDADARQAWSKNWVRYPICVFLYFISFWMITLTTKVAITLNEVLAVRHWIALAIIYILCLYLFYNAVKGIFKKGGER